MTLKEFVTLINRQEEIAVLKQGKDCDCLLYTSPSPRDRG